MEAEHSRSRAVSCSATRRAQHVTEPRDGKCSRGPPPERAPMAAAAALRWLDWAYGLFQVSADTLMQRIYACHLPARLPLPHLSDFTCIVTGASSGIGLEVARQLAEAGAHVVLACRNVEGAQNLVHEWQETSEHFCGPLDVEVMELDLLSLSSVKSFACAWEARRGPLHVLINNAGIFSMSGPQRFSGDGHEEHIQVNHLAPALLTLLLLPSLLRGSPSRVINVNSNMHIFGAVDPNDLNLSSAKRKYTHSAAYSASKLAQMYFSSILQNKLPNDSGLHIICVHPGVVKTNVVRTLPKIIQNGYKLFGFFSLSAVEGARSVIYCATDPYVIEYAETLREEGWPVCSYYSADCKPTAASRQAENMDLAFQVWEKTREAVGLSNALIEKMLKGEDVISYISEALLHFSSEDD